MERQVHKLIESSAEAAHKGDTNSALDRAKEAGKKERQLCKFRETNNLMDQMNLDLTYAVKFNLAVCYQRNKMYTEAINAYQMIVKNKQYPLAGSLRVNIGNILLAQKKYKNAIREYKMALDMIPNDREETRFKIMRNIAHALVRAGKYNEAIENYEVIVEKAKPENTGFPDLATPFNLLVCYYARAKGDVQCSEPE